MTWQVPRIWEGGDVWILGGGPSVLTQFNIPEDIRKDVLSGVSPLSVFSPYMKDLHDKHVIGINVAYLIGDWIDMVFFGDVGFFLQHKEKLALFKGLRVTCHSVAEKYPWVKYLPRDTRHPSGISPKPNMVSWNGNSGAAAISIAANAGAKRIILLGFDMKLDETNKQHWHGVYRKGGVREFNPKKPNGLPFERHMRGFPAIAADAKARGIEIINANPDSAITEFPRYSLKELLYDNS